MFSHMKANCKFRQRYLQIQESRVQRKGSPQLEGILHPQEAAQPLLEALK